MTVLRRAIVDDVSDLVENIVEADENFAVTGKTIVATTTAGIGDLYDSGDGSFTPQVVGDADKERVWRDRELASSDFTQLGDTPLTAGEVTDWATYRDELRDMPTLTGFPDTHTRPEYTPT